MKVEAPSLPALDEASKGFEQRLAAAVSAWRVSGLRVLSAEVKRT